MKSLSLMYENNVDPEKLYYKIGEVSTLLKVKSSVVRYWESEFSLRTTKSKTNQRLYEKKDIEKLLEIKRLLYDERFTLEGAKKFLKETKSLSQIQASNNPKHIFEFLKKELIDISKILDNGQM